MHVCVTGSNSFIGQAFLRYCDAHNIRVTGIDMVPNDREDCFAGDIRDDAIEHLIPEDLTAFVHLAALSRDPDCKGKAVACFESNVMSTLRLMDIVAKKNCQQFIFASSEWVYSHYPSDGPATEETQIDILQHRSEYALSKLVSEANIKQRHAQGFCDSTILRFGIVYGPRPSNWCAVESIMKQTFDKEVITVGSGQTARLFIHVDDVARAIGMSIGCAGLETLNIQGSQLVTLEDVIQISASLFGKTVAIEETDPDSPSVRTVSGAKAKDTIGFEPQISIEDGIRSVAQFLGLI